MNIGTKLREKLDIWNKTCIRGQSASLMGPTIKSFYFVFD